MVLFEKRFSFYFIFKTKDILEENLRNYIHFLRHSPKTVLEFLATLIRDELPSSRHILLFGGDYSDIDPKCVQDACLQIFPKYSDLFEALTEQRNILDKSLRFTAAEVQAQEECMWKYDRIHAKMLPKAKALEKKLRLMETKHAEQASLLIL